MGTCSSIRRRMMMSGGEAPLPDYLAFTPLSDGTFTLSIPSGLATSNLSYVEYSTDEGETWVRTDNVDSTAVTITTPTIEANSRVLWRGKGSRYATSNSVRSIFTASANFNVSGHLQSLLHLDNVNKTNTYSTSYYGLFYGTSTRIRDAKNLIFPASCDNQTYCAMFRDCTYLTQGPWLQATYIAQNGYREMFSGCTRLQRVVTLSTSSASSGSYYNWLKSVPSTCLLVVNYNASASHVTTINSINLTYIYYRTSDQKYFLSDKTTECDENGNPI